MKRETKALLEKYENKKSRRQEAVDKIMADTKLTGYQKARKISNLIKMYKSPKEANNHGKINETSRVHPHTDQQAIPKKVGKTSKKTQA